MKLLMTPDFGLSDVWHLNYPYKNFLSQELKLGRLPFWTDMIGNGYPIAAEGQIGSFSLWNWLIFGFLPMPQAFMVALWSVFLIAGIGTYFFLREINLKRYESIIGSVITVVSGYFIAHMTHLNLLQSFALIPWVLFIVEKFIKLGKTKYLLWLGMILSQMIFVGYPQTFINTFLIIGLYLLSRKIKIRKIVVSLLFSLLIALSLSAVQLIPLLELANQSNTSEAAAKQRFIHPLPIKHLLTIFWPYIFGDPSQGTYPIYNNNWGIFWENILFVGLMPVIGIAYLLFNKLKTSKRIKTSGLWVVLIASLLLALGKNMPTQILFKIPPLSFTRICSRFLVFTNLTLGILGIIGLVQLCQRYFKGVVKYIFWFSVLAFQIGETILAFGNYHLWGEAADWLNPPPISNSLPVGSRIISFGQSWRWNNTFLTIGWRGQEKTYLQNRNSLDQDSNMIFGIKQIGVYAQQLPIRQEVIQRNMYGDNVLGENIRNVYGVTHIIDARNEGFEIMNNETALPDIRVSQNIIKVRDMYEALGRMNQESFNPQVDVLWEADKLPGPDEETVVINRSYYPGWKAFLSQKQIEIYPVNINQQAVIVPKNTDLSLLKFKYDPLSYKIGGGISIVSLLVWVFLFRKFRYNI